jgi:hypothetical protein
MRIKRDDLAIVACILSAAALGYGYLSHHLDAVDVFDWLWIIWFVIAQWLSGRWWRTVNLPVGGIYQEAKRGSLRLTLLCGGARLCDVLDSLKNLTAPRAAAFSADISQYAQSK